MGRYGKIWKDMERYGRRRSASDRMIISFWFGDLLFILSTTG